MSETHPLQDELAIKLAIALKHLKARLKEETRADTSRLSLSQLSILHKLSKCGAQTAAVLAAAEHVSQQAIAQILVILKGEGLVESTADPKDGRKTLINISDAGCRLLNDISESRNAWLVQAIDIVVDQNERAILSQSIDIIERLANCGKPSPIEKKV